MTGVSTRTAGWAGVLFIVLISAALFAPGAPPKANDSAASIAHALGDHRAAIVGGLFVAGLAAICAVWFFAAIPGWVQGPGGWAAAGGGALGVVLILVGLLFFFGATFDATTRASLPTVRGLTDAGNAAIELSKFGTALFIAGLLLATRGTALLRGWIRAWGWLAIPAALVSAVALFSRGDVTQFGGGLDLAGAAPATAWILAVAVVQIRQAQP